MQQARVTEEQTRGDVGAVGETNGNDAVAIELVCLRSRSDECRKLVGPASQVLLVEHALGYRRKNRGAPFSRTLPRGLSIPAPGSNARPRESGRLRLLRCRAAGTGWSTGHCGAGSRGHVPVHEPQCIATHILRTGGVGKYSDSREELEMNRRRTASISARRVSNRGEHSAARRVGRPAC